MIPVDYNIYLVYEDDSKELLGGLPEKESREIIAQLAVEFCTFDDISRVIDGLAEKMSNLSATSSATSRAGESDSGDSGRVSGPRGTEKPATIRRKRGSNSENGTEPSGDTDGELPTVEPVGPRTKPGKRSGTKLASPPVREGSKRVAARTTTRK